VPALAVEALQHWMTITGELVTPYIAICAVIAEVTGWKRNWNRTVIDATVLSFSMGR
jgi:hypothetical protein